MSTRDAKAQEPRPADDIKRTSSWACAIATSRGGFLGLLFDSVKNIGYVQLLKSNQVLNVHFSKLHLRNNEKYF